MKAFVMALGALAALAPLGLVQAMSPRPTQPGNATNSLQPIATARELRKLPVTAFQEGEKLKYDLHYGVVSAGVAELIVDKKLVLGGHPVMHIVAKGRSLSSFDWVYRVRDTYESYLDLDHSLPWLFVRTVNEGGFKINQNVRFNHYLNKAVSNTATVPTPENVQDIVSAFYAARNMDLSWMRPNDFFTMPVFLDDTVFNLKMKYVGRETISTDAGTYKCQVYYPQLLAGRVFKNDSDMKIWVSDDQNRIPMQVSAAILIGTISMTITDIKGLKWPSTARTGN